MAGRPLGVGASRRGLHFVRRCDILLLGDRLGVDLPPSRARNKRSRHPAPALGATRQRASSGFTSGGSRVDCGCPPSSARARFGEFPSSLRSRAAAIHGQFHEDPVKLAERARDRRNVRRASSASPFCQSAHSA
ncbi:hypothetical protein ZWY2020_005462 [Hordeum vulgare]|nr:hypothetical protein ZWY2020_005462 [Hordeum vulgare]